MKSFRTTAALVVAGAIRTVLRLAGKGATNLPGKIALRICPSFLSKIAYGKNVIMITGTNGKTTTTHMISEMLRKSGYMVATNVSGANLAAGLATTFAEYRSRERRAVKNRVPAVYVLETDEAAFAKTAGELNPSVCVVTNLFRDQLDRFGELLTTRKCIEKGLDSCNARILLNADDSMISALQKDREERVIFFGLDEAGMTRNIVTNTEDSGSMKPSSDAEYCLKCKKKFIYTARSFGHFGIFECPSCKDHRRLPQYAAYCEQEKAPNDESTMILKKGEHIVRTSLPIMGVHNVYNSIAAAAACVTFGEEVGDERLTIDFCAKALPDIRPAFGRMEKINVGSKSFCILLVKNPVGLDRALCMVSEASDVGGLYLLLNSNIADGTDVSWIWDVDFENRTFPDRLYVSGERYAEMLLRLIYSGAAPENIRSAEMSQCEKLFEEALAACPDGKCLYVLPNYTAMLALRKYLVGRFRLRNFWK